MRTTSALLLAAAAALATLTTSVSAFAGELTYYGAGQDSRGACGGNGLPTGPGGIATVAMNGVQYYPDNGKSVCGKCIKITSKGSGAGANPPPSVLYAAVNNLCPECKYGDIDLAWNGERVIREGEERRGAGCTGGRPRRPCGALAPGLESVVRRDEEEGAHAGPKAPSAALHPRPVCDSCFSTFCFSLTLFLPLHFNHSQSGDGRWSVEWQYVSCDEAKGAVSSRKLMNTAA